MCPKVSAVTKKKSKPSSSSPKVSKMVFEALKGINDQKGSSLLAIKKYISSNNDVDIKLLTPAIKKFLTNAVKKGSLIQSRGKFRANVSKRKSEKIKQTKDLPKKRKYVKSTLKNCSEIRQNYEGWSVYEEYMELFGNEMVSNAIFEMKQRDMKDELLWRIRAAISDD